MAGVKYPAKMNGRKVEAMRGRSLTSLLNGSIGAVYSPDAFVGGEMLDGKWMRQGEFKAVLIPMPYGTGEWMLFNVAKDPGEANDLSKNLPKKLQTLMAAWDKYASDVGVVSLQ
jgi:arylsulfatase